MSVPHPEDLTQGLAELRSAADKAATALLAAVGHIADVGDYKSAGGSPTTNHRAVLHQMADLLRAMLQWAKKP